MIRPTFICDNVYLIDYASFSKSGVSNIIFDIDNTLISYDYSLPDEKLRKLIEGLKANGFRIFILSNGHSERAKKFSESLDLIFRGDAFKPSQKGYKALTEEHGIRPENTLMVGDQLFTDIWGANKYGCKSVLVKPIKLSNEPAFVKFKRVLEKPMMNNINKKINKMGE